MTIGERIYRLRMEKNMSQGNLAEKLEVSRQSVSKWENNSALPDLDKIIKLSEIFGVTIDEIVKGASTDKLDMAEQNTQYSEKAKVEYVYVQPQKTMESRKIAGIVLFGMAFLLTFGLLLATGSLGGIFYAVPFIICGIICFTVSKHTGIWCCWAVYFMADLFRRWGTSINPSLVLLTFKFKPEMNYTRLICAWIWVVLLAVLIVCTVKSFKNTPVKNINRLKRNVTVGWILWVGIYIGITIFTSSQMYMDMLQNWMLSDRVVFFVVFHLLSLVRILVLSAAITGTAIYLNNRKKF